MHSSRSKRSRLLNDIARRGIHTFGVARYGESAVTARLRAGLRSQRRGEQAGGGNVAEELVRYPLAEGGFVLVEVRAGAAGYEHCSRVADGVIEAGRTLESAFEKIVPSTRAVLHSVAELHASEVHVEFGIKLA